MYGRGVDDDDDRDRFMERENVEKVVRGRDSLKNDEFENVDKSVGSCAAECRSVFSHASSSSKVFIAQCGQCQS